MIECMVLFRVFAEVHKELFAAGFCAKNSGAYLPISQVSTGLQVFY